MVMSITLTLEEAQAKLPELIASLAPGEEVVITRDAEPVAELHLLTKVQPRPQFGSCRGMLTIVTEDDEHLADFKDYMP
jgi:antitoxin (DNA-binding transcriptional repressor) of toxin-antitoxin stability system